MWKNLTFLIGLGWLLYGAKHFSYLDWDVPISFLMALSTYLTADRFIRALKARNWWRAGCLTVAVWWSTDGVYWLYWSLVDKTVMLREGQWAMSLCLYLLCGMVWTAFDPEKQTTILPLHPEVPDRPDSGKLPILPGR